MIVERNRWGWGDCFNPVYVKVGSFDLDQKAVHQSCGRINRNFVCSYPHSVYVEGFKLLIQLLSRVNNGSTKPCVCKEPADLPSLHFPPHQAKECPLQKCLLLILLLPEGQRGKKIQPQDLFCRINSHFQVPTNPCPAHLSKIIWFAKNWGMPSLHSHRLMD